MLEVFYSAKHSLKLEEQITVVDKKDFVLKELLAKSSFGDIKLKEDDKILTTFDKLFEFDIKVTSVGKFIFYFSDSFDKDEITNNVSKLRNLEITDKDSKINKLKSLVEIIKEANPTLSIFVPEDLSITESDMSFVPFKLVYVKQLTQEEIEQSKNTKIGKYFARINSDKLYLIFSFVACIIIMFSLCLAIHNCYINNAIYIFFFICALGGTILNTIIYKDMYKKNKILSSSPITNLILDFIAVAGSLGLFILYYNSLKNLPEYAGNKSTIALIASLSSIGLILISFLIPLLIKKLIKKKK